MLFSLWRDDRLKEVPPPHQPTKEMVGEKVSDV